MGLVILGILQYARPIIVISGIPLSGLAFMIVGVLVWILAGHERAMAGRWRYASEVTGAQVIDANGRIISGHPLSGHPGEAQHLSEHPPREPYAPSQQGSGPPQPGMVRRVYRLPNGTFVVVEEYVRW